MLNRPTTLTDADQAGYLASFVCDANGNIEELEESVTFGMNTGYLYNYFVLDDLNRMTESHVKYYNGANWQWVKRIHQYNATGAVQRTDYMTYPDGGSGTVYQAEHSWDQAGRHVQNSLASSYGGVWHWAGSDSAGPLRSPNADTASQDAYNVSAGGGAGTPVRRSFIDPTTEGDERNLWAQGMPNAKDSVAAWAAGTISAVTDLLGVEPPVESRFEFKGTVAPTDLSRATDAREKGRVGMFGSGYSYAGSSPRITSETIGRDINPLGRGDGQAYVGGMMRLGQIYPPLPNSTARVGQGNSVNNDIGSVGGPAGLYGPPDCQGTLPGCCCETIAANVDSYDEGSPPCNYADAIQAACYENGCDAEKCLKAKCDHVKCLRDSGRIHCTNCDCGGDGGAGVGAGGITLPIGGGSCPGCGGGGANIPDTGDIFGARFGPAGSGGGGMGGLGGGWFRPGGSIKDNSKLGSILSLEEMENNIEFRKYIDQMNRERMIREAARNKSVSGGELIGSRVSMCCCCCKEYCTSQECKKYSDHVSKLKDNYDIFNAVFMGLGLIGTSIALIGGGFVAALIVATILLGIWLLYTSVPSPSASDCDKCMNSCLFSNGVNSFDEFWITAAGLYGIAVVGALLGTVWTIMSKPILGYVGYRLDTNPYNDYFATGKIKCEFGFIANSVPNPRRPSKPGDLIIVL